ncbi:MAG TPA: cytochrome c3 family protein [Polyangiaceae bacterium]|jgi:hypothetical protein|nr:cytochrome c3 family protein [Polyangiaceae bacterium]
MPSVELACFIAVTGLCLVAILRGTAGGLRFLALGAFAVTLVLAASRSRAPGAPSPIARTPQASGAVGSGACRSCHPAEYASWHASFHRTMTTVPTPSTVLGSWAGVRVEADGRSIELSRRGDEFWLRLPDPDVVSALARAGAHQPSAQAPLVSRRVLLVTGSHHHQVYWVGGERGNELRLAPLTYLVAERRYIARHDAFLQPPDAPAHAVRWNSNCIACHATRGEPRLDEQRDVFASSAVELGIACEACHGPGAAHAEKQRNPVTRLRAHLTHAADPSIVNPARLPSSRASEICGQCHAYFVPRDEDRFWTAGYDYHPGDVLEHSRTLVEPPAAGERAGSDHTLGGVDAESESLFWGDGTIRVGGREFNGLAASACYRRGSGERRLSCLSCHSLHESDPDDQLRRGTTPDAACARCHEHEAALGTQHTHHPAGSSGSRCVSCHMPFTSYALFTAIRAHRIDSPSALSTAKHGRPNACNLCHLDRTLGWTNQALEAWFGAPRTGSSPLSPEARAKLESPTARAVEELLAGDAAARVVAAAAFGRAEALQASGNDWEASVLAELASDPYAAVRKVAAASLASLPGAGASERRDPALPLDSGGRRDEARIRALLAARDEHPITISE